MNNIQINELGWGVQKCIYINASLYSTGSQTVQWRKNGFSINSADTTGLPDIKNGYRTLLCLAPYKKKKSLPKMSQ